MFETLNITAFGKTLSVPKAILEKIPSMSNGVQLTYENGYEELGGRTVYVIFIRGFISEAKEKFTLSVNEQGRAEVVP